jgi:hypothetical protein
LILMANPEHLALVKKGVEAWNTWRKTYPEIKPDLAGAHLKSTDLWDANLTADFSLV